jgi:EPS-associated MarR family transcriptional regulator
MIEPSYKILKIIEDHPEYSQRKIATELGYSLGKVNYVLSALIEKGIIKIQKFLKSNNKFGYRYILTPRGIAEKYKITRAFLKRKLEEYEYICKEIEEAKMTLEKRVIK